MNAKNQNSPAKPEQSADERHAQKHEPAPSPMTLGILRQFARVYRVEKLQGSRFIAICPN